MNNYHSHFLSLYRCSAIIWYLINDWSGTIVTYVIRPDLDKMTLSLNWAAYIYFYLKLC